ncbi:mucin-binding protein [Limosilactobacillus urinaemulieris]|uniref:mucin-binding protein n=1 Tax=Limosilactobacillus urinaemulieris TaxID=2742600 RepID=UPI001F56514C|nr:YSIRK-type signal peptide-containing protein [Limosilactobacillus urinaemulieris]
MLSSNNKKEQIKKQQSKKQRFAIKKLTVGVASVLIGFTFMGLNASADSTTTGSATVGSETQVNDSQASPANTTTNVLPAAGSVTTKTPTVPDSPTGVHFSDTPASSTTVTVPESSADSGTGNVASSGVQMTYYYNSMVTIKTPDGKESTVGKQQLPVTTTNGSGPTEADVANLSFNSVSLPSFAGYTPVVSTLTEGLPLATISDNNGQLSLVFPKIQADYQSYYYTVTYEKNASTPVTDKAQQEIDIKFPLNLGNVQINDQNAYYYRTTASQNVESTDNGQTWTSASFAATSLNDALEGTYTNAQTGYRGQTLPKFPGYTPFLSAVFVTGSDAYRAEASALLTQLKAAIAQNPYEIPAYTLNSPLMVTFHVSYKTNTWQQIDVRFEEQPGDTTYYYKTNSQQEISQNVNGNTWEPVSYGATSLNDALEGTYTNAQTGYRGQTLPSHPGYVPYISGVVVGNDDTYQAEASALLNQLNAAIAQNPYEIPAYTLTVPLNVSFHVSYKKVSTPVTPVQNTTVTYVFHDDIDNKTIGGSTSVSGLPGTIQSVNLTIPEGYKLAEGQTLPTNVTMPSADETITIHLVHETKTVTPGEPGVTPDNPAYEDLFHKVTRTIIVNDPVTGQAETTTQTVIFGRTGTYDEVTKQFTNFGDWKVYNNADNKLTDATTGSWGEFDAPEFSGYTPSQAKVDAETVNAETADQTVVINYTKSGNDNNNGNNDNNSNGNNDNTNNNGNNNGNGGNSGNSTNGNNGGNTTNGNNGGNENTTNSITIGDNNTTVNNTKKANTLPQTGNEQNTAAVAGLALAGLTAMLGLGGLKKKEN